MLLALSLGSAPVLRDFSWVLSSASELTADGGKADGECPKHSTPGSLSALLPTPACHHFFLCLKRIGTAAEMCSGAATSEAGDIAVPAPCPRPWCQCSAVPWEVLRSAAV